MGSGDIDYINIWVIDEFVVGAIGFDTRGSTDLFEECLGAGGGGGGCSCYDGVFNIMNIASCGVAENVFAEGWRRVSRVVLEGVWRVRGDYWLRCLPWLRYPISLRMVWMPLCLCI